MRSPHIYLLTAGKGHCGKQTEERVESALRGGLAWIQLREKHMEQSALHDWALALMRVAARYGTGLIINDDVELAVRIGAAGVHVGQDDMPCAQVRKYLPRGVIGVSCHSVAELYRAMDEGADYVGAGAVFATSTKRQVTPLAIENLRNMTSVTRIPVWAIGGITVQTAKQMGHCGVQGYAVASAVWNAPNPGAVVRQLERIWQKNER